MKCGLARADAAPSVYNNLFFSEAKIVIMRKVKAILTESYNRRAPVREKYALLGIY